MALVAIERGISTKQLEQFYYVSRKGAKKRHFNHRAFAEKYDISIDWIYNGFICEHPRGAAQATARPVAGTISPKEARHEQHRRVSDR